MSEAEKQRLRQHILQSKASKVVMIPQIDRFSGYGQNIDRLRLIESQILAGKVPLSEQLKKDQKKKKKKAKKGKQLRGDLARNLREQRRFVRGERRDNDAEEPRIVGDPLPPVPGAPQNINVNIPGLAAAIARLGLAPLAPPAPPPQNINVNIPALAPPAVAQAPPAVALAPPAVAQAPPRLPARADADPIPEIVRLEERLRGDYQRLGDEIGDRNRHLFESVRGELDDQERFRRQDAEEFRARQAQQDEFIRNAAHAGDARFLEIQERLGEGELSIGESRDRVLQEIAAVEQRLGRRDPRVTPLTYNEIIIEELEQPSPIQPQRSIIEGGGELELPDLVIAPEELRLEPASPRRLARGSGGQSSPIIGGGRGETSSQRLARLLEEPSPSTRSSPGTRSSPLSLGIPEERLRSGGGSGTAQFSDESSESSLDITDPRLRLVDTQDFMSSASPYPLGGFDRPVDEPLSVSERVANIEALEATADSSVGSVVEFLPGAEVNERPLREEEEEGGEVDFLNPDEVGLVQETGAQNIEQSKRTYKGSFETLSSQLRPGPTGERGAKRGKGFRVRNNTDRRYKKIEPGDVVDVIGSQAGNQGQGVYILDTGAAKGSQVSLPSLNTLIDDGSLIFEKGHRHELGGHFEENPYGPPGKVSAQVPEPEPEPESDLSGQLSGEEESEELQRQIREGQG
jgi:hypothetical protein